MPKTKTVTTSTSLLHNKDVFNFFYTRKVESKQLKIWEPSQAKEEVSPYLEIASVPVNERINPHENRYILVILPLGCRAAAGQYTAKEAHVIANAVKGWNWWLGADDRLRCLARLEALLDSICKRSFGKGGAK